MESRRAVTGASTILVRRLKLAGLLVSGGLLVEVGTLYWSHPMAFLAFLGLGGLLVCAGILLYLYSLVS
jgi:hypothetical protein